MIDVLIFFRTAVHSEFWRGFGFSVDEVIAADDRTVQPAAAAIEQGTAIATITMQQTIQQAKRHLEQVTVPWQPPIANWQQTADEAVQQVNIVASQAMDQVHQATRSMLDHSWQQTEFFAVAAVDRVQMVLFGAVQDWLIAHPVINWLLSHPLYTLGLVLLLLFLTAGLLRAIAHLTEKIWLFVLRSPLQLGTWLFRLVANLLRIKLAESADQSQSPPDSQQRLDHIMTRLETLQQEQDQLMQELKTILTLEQNYKGDR